MHVANEAGFLAIGDAVDANVQHGRARFEPVATHQLGLADGSDDDIGFAAARGKVGGA